MESSTVVVGMPRVEEGAPVVFVLASTVEESAACKRRQVKLPWGIQEQKDGG